MSGIVLWKAFSTRLKKSNAFVQLISILKMILTISWLRPLAFQWALCSPSSPFKCKPKIRGGGALIFSIQLTDPISFWDLPQQQLQCLKLLITLIKCTVIRQLCFWNIHGPLNFASLLKYAINQGGLTFPWNRTVSQRSFPNITSH